MVKLYRAVSKSEKDDYDDQHVLRTGRNTLEAKQFFKSREAVNEFVANARLQQYDPPYEYLLIISTNNLEFDDPIYTNMPLDGYEAISIHEDNLPTFNNYIKFVEQETL